MAFQKRTFDYDKAIEMFKAGMTAREIGEKLGVSRGAVLNVMHRAHVYRTKATPQDAPYYRDGYCGKRDFICGICGKAMYVSVPEEYVYKIVRKKTIYYCSYTCYRKAKAKIK